MANAKESKPFAPRLRRWTRDHWIAIAGLASGILVGCGIPIWQNYWVERPHLKVEITGIERRISPEARVSLDDYPELRALSRYAWRLRSSRPRLTWAEDAETESGASGAKTGRSVTLDELNELLTFAKEDLARLPERIKAYREDQERTTKLSPASISLPEVTQLNDRFSMTTDPAPVDRAEFIANSSDRTKNKGYFDTLIGNLQKAYDKRLTNEESRYRELQTSIPSIERRVETLTLDFTRKRSFFTVSTVLSNSGKAGTSVRRPVLLRIYIGSGNYVDLMLRPDGSGQMLRPDGSGQSGQSSQSGQSAEIPATGTRGAVFRSDEVSKLPEDDQKLVSAYWGQSVHAILFVEDVFGQIVASNSIPFSEGLYEKTIYDRLRTVASKPEHGRTQ